MNADPRTTTVVDAATHAPAPAGVEPLKPGRYTPVPNLLLGDLKNLEIAAAIAKVVGAFGEYRAEAELHHIADQIGGPEFEAADNRWMDYLERLRSISDEITEPQAQSYDELHQQILAYLRAEALYASTDWREYSAAEAIEIIERHDSGALGVVAKTVMEALPRLMARPAAERAAWDKAVANLQRERQWLDDNQEADTPDSFYDATDALLAVPAPDAEALAFKIGVVALDNGIICGNRSTFDVLTSEFPDREAILEQVVDGQEEAAKALLLIYDDAKALAAKAPAATEEPEPDDELEYLARAAVFGGWDPAPVSDVEQLPPNTEWATWFEAHCPAIRLACLTLTYDLPSLVKLVWRLGDLGDPKAAEPTSELDAMLGTFKEASDFFAPYTRNLDGAFSRLLSAYAVKTQELDYLEQRCIDPENWLAEFERQGGSVHSRFDGARFRESVQPPAGDRGQAMLDQLSRSPELLRAVFGVASRREV
jgi:hypothetical protein